MAKKEIFRNKKGIELEVLGWIILGIITMVIIIIAYTLLTGKGTSALDFLKNLFTFRR
jgi:uncharacterized protein (UPF0333 family)